MRHLLRFLLLLCQFVPAQSESRPVPSTGSFLQLPRSPLKPVGTKPAFPGGPERSLCASHRSRDRINRSSALVSAEDTDLLHTQCERGPLRLLARCRCAGKARWEITEGQRGEFQPGHQGLPAALPREVSALSTENSSLSRSQKRRRTYLCFPCFSHHLHFTPDRVAAPAFPGPWRGRTRCSPRSSASLLPTPLRGSSPKPACFSLPPLSLPRPFAWAHSAVSFSFNTCSV